MADLFEETIALGANPKKVSNWLMGETMRLMKEHSLDADKLTFSAKHLAKLIEMVDNKVINSNVAKEVFEKIFTDDIEPETYVNEHGLATVNDEGALKKVVEEVIANNPKSNRGLQRRKRKKSTGGFGRTDNESHERKSGPWYCQSDASGIIKIIPGKSFYEVRYYGRNQTCKKKRHL